MRERCIRVVMETSNPLLPKIKRCRSGQDLAAPPPQSGDPERLPAGRGPSDRLVAQNPSPKSTCSAWNASWKRWPDRGWRLSPRGGPSLPFGAFSGSRSGSATAGTLPPGLNCPHNLWGPKAGGIHHGQGRLPPTKGRIHWRGPPVIFRFRLQTSGGPYIADNRGNTAMRPGVRSRVGGIERQKRES